MTPASDNPAPHRLAAAGKSFLLELLGFVAIAIPVEILLGLAFGLGAPYDVAIGCLVAMFVQGWWKRRRQPGSERGL